jgi:uracil phosphoribosyltransferase
MIKIVKNIVLLFLISMLMNVLDIHQGMNNIHIFIIIELELNDDDYIKIRWWLRFSESNWIMVRHQLG